MYWIGIGIGILLFVLLCVVLIGYLKVMYPSAMKCGDGRIKIACVGDSITYGFGVFGKRKKWSYPALLAKHLGSDYTTINYGLCDRTLLSSADKPFFKEKLGKLAFDTDADIVIFMLGSNDCKKKNWNAQKFREEYIDIIRHYTEAGKELYVMIPPKMFYKRSSKSGYDARVLDDELVPIMQSVVDETGVRCMDLFAITKDHPEWFPDKIHPNKAGNIAMAELIAACLKKDIAGKNE